PTLSAVWSRAFGKGISRKQRSPAIRPGFVLLSEGISKRCGRCSSGYDFCTLKGKNRTPSLVVEGTMESLHIDTFLLFRSLDEEPSTLRPCVTQTCPSYRWVSALL